MLKLRKNTVHSFADEFFRECKMSDFEERIECKVEKLNLITQVQDIMNLDVMVEFRKKFPDMNEDEEKRWVPIHMVDNANAIILGITESRFRPRRFWHKGSYVKEKMDALETKRWTLGHINRPIS